jgi:DNA-binding XRE family transcriptional regulator
MGNVLRDVREKVGRTQEDVARAVSLTRTSLTNIEKGRQKLLLHTFADIATFLGRTPSDLLADIQAKLAEKSPIITVPTNNLSPKAHEQISDMIVESREATSHAKSSPQSHPRKSRIAAQ